MNKYSVRFRYQNGGWGETIIFASCDFDAKAIAESQFGPENVMSYWRIYE